MIRANKNTKQTRKQKNSEHFTEPNKKLLLERFPYTSKDFQLKDVPVLTIDQSFFADPFKTIDDLYAKGYEKFGIVKLILPPDLVVPNKKFFALLENKLQGKRIQTRIQTLNTQRAGEIFGSNIPGFTIQEYCLDKKIQFLGSQKLYHLNQD